MKVDPETGLKVYVDLSWKKFGKSTVQDKFRRRSNGGTEWLVKCECGTEWWCWAEVIQRSPGLCCKGCRNEIVRVARTVHGGRYTRLYINWRSMIRRCYDPNERGYEYWGGAGLKVCERWRNFTYFREDMGPTYVPGLTIHRTDKNGHYSCGKCEECKRNGWVLHCKWATKFEQAQERRNTVYLTAYGKTQNISQWSRETGVNKTVIRQRQKRGCSPEECLYPWKPPAS